MATLPVSYSAVSDILTVEPKIGSVTAVTSAQLFFTLGQAEALVNGKIVRNYTLPLPSVPPLIASISIDVAIYYILVKRLFTATQLEDSPWPDRYKEALETLEQISEGKMLLLGTDGAVLATRTDLSEVFSTTQGYLPTMTERGPEYDIIDTNKIDDLNTERENL